MFNLNLKYFKYIFIVLLISMLQLGTNTWLNFSFMFNNKFWLFISYFFTFYWLYSIFIFLSKHNKYSLYTNVSQRFWKRALALFWIVEFFLFSIYLFLVVNYSVEVEWFLDQPQLFLNNYLIGSNFFKNLLLILFIIVLLCYSQIILQYKKIINISLVLLVTLFFFNLVFKDEFNQLFVITTYYSGTSWIYDASNNTWGLNVAVDKTRAHLHFSILLVILKFWHVMFILIVFLGSIMFYSQLWSLTQDTLAINKLNVYYLFIFMIIMQYTFFKNYMNYVYEHVYTWFFVNKFFSNQIFSINFLKCL